MPALTQIIQKYQLPVEDATVRFYFEISPKKHVPGAKKMDKTSCVIAQAFKGQPGVEATEIGAAMSYLIFKHKIVRYQTPTRLRDALNAFDVSASGQWNLPAGVYYLNPPRASYEVERRREIERHRTGKQKHGKGDPKKGMCRKASINPRYIAGLKQEAK